MFFNRRKLILLFTILMHMQIQRAASDWITSYICDSISCDILSETRRHYVMAIFIGLQVNIRSCRTVLCSWQPLVVGHHDTFSLSFGRKMLIVH